MYPTATPPLVLNERVPDPAVKILDPSFEKYRLPLASVERLSQGYSWAEGPVYFGDARCLLWSDIPNNRIMRWDEETGATSDLSQALELRQRQHPRPPGPPGHRRARPARHPHRIRRPHHRADGPLRRQAAEFAERHRGEVRRLDLVHRHERRHRRQLERRDRRAGTAAAGLPHRRQDRAGDDRHRRPDPAAERARVLARREEALCDREPARRARDLRLRRRPATAASSPTAAS